MLLLLDSASLYFRAFFAIKESITAPDGRPVNAVRGFTDMVAALINRHQPTRVVACLDLDWRPQFRVERIPTYKSHRLDTSAGAKPGEEIVPDALEIQVPMLLDILAAAGIARAGAAGCEADDVIGTLAAQELSDEVVVVSGDRDLLQVVREEPNPVRVYYVGRGLAKAELYGPAEVAAKYGVPAERAGAAYAELALLRGDASDGLPGVKGVGEKSASSLLLTYGSLAAARAAAVDPNSDLSQSMRAKLTAADDYIEAALPVVRVLRDAEVKMSGSDVLPAEPDDLERLQELGTALNAESPVARLITAMRNRAGA